MTGPSASRVLTTKIGLARQSLNRAHDRFWERSDVTELFCELQQQTYHLARASIPLMEAARERCLAMPDDPVAQGTIDFLEQHIEEELHHDTWLLEDLEALGRPAHAVTSQPASTTAAQLVGMQYYWIHHEHPIALVGYMAALEGGVVDEQFVLDFLDRTGLPPEGARTLLLHARVDPHHERELARLLDSLPLEPRHSEALGTSAIATVELLAALVEQVVARADRIR